MPHGFFCAEVYSSTATMLGKIILLVILIIMCVAAVVAYRTWRNCREGKTTMWPFSWMCKFVHVLG